LPFLDQEQGTIIVVFDFVNPAFPVRRLFNECRKLGFDEMKPGHGPDLASKTGEFESEVGWGLL
jgi:hypothetical protein